MGEPTFVSSVHYRDPKAALAFLTRAFGFEVTMAIEGPDGDPSQCHFELAIEGCGRLMVGGEWDARVRSPASLDGANTQSVHVTLSGGLDDHCAQARAAGAVIDAEPADQFYGDRTYRAVDLEGHRWNFSEHTRDVTRAEAERAIGTPIVAPGWA